MGLIDEALQQLDSALELSREAGQVKEQAMRLGLTYDDVSKLDGVEHPPSVATRCAVFAKSDLIHLQQAGASAQEMWSGLCRGMAQTAMQTLLKGRPLGAQTALVGGVMHNREVLRWLRDLAS